MQTLPFLRVATVLIALAILAAFVAPAAAAPPHIPAAFERGTITRRPYVVMIDNHPNAYPQTGLDKAAVVFEALAEGGITRFMAVYIPGVSPDVPSIGPVRSARLYFVRWAMGMNGMYVHAGGAPDALKRVREAQEIIDVDALARSGGAYFTRVRTRKAPHNLYTSTARLDQAAARFGNAEINNPELGFLIKAEAPPEQRPTVQELGYYFIYRQDSVGWVYDPANNVYLRLRRGKPAVDAATDQQLRASNVVVIEVQERPIPGDPKGRIQQDVIGSGPGFLFQDGVAREITWRKESEAAPLRFYLADGSEAAMNPGQVWIAAVPKLGNLTVR
jgi:hypothetical protein